MNNYIPENKYIPENIECFFSSDEDDDDDCDEELIRVADRVVATSGIEKALSISMNFEPSCDHLRYTSTSNNSILSHNKSTYYILPELINKNGKQELFEGKHINYPIDFLKWNKNIQDNWKRAVRHEALRPFYISILRRNKE